MKKVLTLALTALFAFAVNASTVCHEDVDCSKVQGKEKLEKCDKAKLDKKECGEKADKSCCSKHKLAVKNLDEPISSGSKPDTKKGDKKGGDKPEKKDTGKLDPGKIEKPKK